MENNRTNELVFTTDNPEKACAEETIIARSVSATNKINEWEKSRPKSWTAAAVPAAIAAIIFFLQTTTEDYSLRRSFSTPGMQLLVCICLVLAAFLLYCGQKAQKTNAQIVSDARRKASKESIIITNQRIYGSTESKSFSIPLSEIQESHIERTIINQNGKISDESLCIKSHHETLVFEFLENSAEISNTIKSMISTSPSTTVQTKSSKKIETYSIKVIGYSSWVPAVAAICNSTGADYVSAKEFLDRHPAILAENISIEKAEEYGKILENGKVEFEIFKS